LLAKPEISREESSSLSRRHHSEPIKDKLTECENSVSDNIWRYIQSSGIFENSMVFVRESQLKLSPEKWGYHPCREKAG
jgi:hypothetical protein